MKKNECVCGCVRKWHEDGLGLCVNCDGTNGDVPCRGFTPKYQKLQKVKT
jgi:hypothetical protein